VTTIRVGAQFGRLTVVAERPRRREPCGRMARLVVVVCACGRRKSSVWQPALGDHDELRVSGPRLGVHTDGGTPTRAEGHVHRMTRDPLIADLHAVIDRIASRVLVTPDWLLRDVSTIDRVLVERVMELAVVIKSDQHDVVH
jgi:hypothetical protein